MVWTAVNDLVVEVLGASNPKLVAIEGGMDTMDFPAKKMRRRVSMKNPM